MTTYAFTSAAAGYLPKARVLARSIKKPCPTAHVCLLLAECKPIELPVGMVEFDEVVTLEDLAIPDLKSWMFEHSLVELCTAIKGRFLEQLLEREDCESAFYFDPDIVVCCALDELAARFDAGSILLTPHLTAPDDGLEAILDNEVAALKHGVYNLGFLGVRADTAGRRFARWWWNRLRDLCFDDIPGGLFTDQRWVDLVPAFFPEAAIVRDPTWNVATWNLGHRRVTGNLREGLTVDGKPLKFYHFSGFDSGAQLAMLRKYGSDMPALFELRDWYQQNCVALGEQSDGSQHWRYDHFANGETIQSKHRWLYRQRSDLRSAFPDPYATADINHSYYDWYRVNHAEQPPAAPLSVEEAEALQSGRRELEQIVNSRAWRAVQLIWGITRPLRRLVRRCLAAGNAWRRLQAR
jgi:hypothetical protein